MRPARTRSGVPCARCSRRSARCCGFARCAAHALALLATVLGLALAAGRPSRAADYALFEAGQVRPLALSRDGRTLYALNTPDDRLEVFRVGRGGQLTRDGSVPVGMRPVALAVRDSGEVW